MRSSAAVRSSTAGCGNIARRRCTATQPAFNSRLSPPST